MNIKPQYIDELTGIYNRRYLKEIQGKKIETFIKKNIPFSVIMVDIDHFKEINDTYGHLKGDEIINEFARFLKSTLRTSDKAIRFGGDEFICVISNTGRQNSRLVCERILKGCKEKEFAGINITLSVGLASFPDNGRDLMKLLEIADNALYDAKRSGRDQIGTIRKIKVEIPIKLFIDRIKEKDALRRLLTNSKKNLKVAIIKGTIGIGKTRLIREVLNEIKEREIIWSDCLFFAENIAYYPIREAIKYRIQRAGKKILKDIPLVYKIELGKLIPEVMEEIMREIDAAELVVDKYRLYESIKKLIEIGGKHKIFIFDNVQWIDKESTEVLKYLLRSLIGAPNTFLFIYRTEEKTELLEDFLSYITREVELSEFNLMQFGTIDLKECLKAIIGEKPETKLIEYVLHNSGGNPFYIEEIMRVLISDRYLVIDEDKWKFKKPETETVPRSIEDIAMRKYRILSKEARYVLEIASVIGYFDIEIIKGITHYNEGHIIGLMNDISEVGLAREVRGKLTFGEGVSRNAIYKKSVAGIKGIILHQEVGKKIEEKNRGKERDVVEELAFHYFHGQCKEKGVKYCIEAGDKAKEKYANLDAISYYTWAMELLKDVQEEKKIKTSIDCLVKRADVLNLTGDNERALKDFEQGLQEAKKLKDKKRETFILYKKASVFLNFSKYKQTIKNAEKCKKLSKEIGDRNNTARSLNVIAIAYLRLTEYKKSMKFFEKALKIFKEMGNKTYEAKVMNNIGVIYQDIGELHNAINFYEDTLKIAKEIGDKSTIALSLNNIGNVYADLGKHFRAMQFYEDSLKIRRETGNKNSEVYILVNIGDTYIELGDYKNALKFYEESLKKAREIGHEGIEAASLNGIGRIYFHRGDCNNALMFYKQAHKIIKQISVGAQRFNNILAIGELYLTINKMKKAKDFMDKAYKIATTTESRQMLSRILSLLCEYHLAEGNLENFEKTIKNIEGLGKEIKTKSLLGNVDLLLGRYYIKTKDFDKANKHLKRSLNLFEELKAQLNIGKVHYFMGLMKLARGKKSLFKKHLQNSLEIFTSLNANSWKEKVEKSIAEA